MSLELYNTTNNTRTVPKYRYNGKVTLAPKGAMDIEDYMSSFYKPYASIGVVVRVKASSEDNVLEERATNEKVSVTKVINEKDIKPDKEEKDKLKSETTEDVKVVEEGNNGESSFNIDSNTEDTSIEEPNTSDGSVVETKKYTKESLMNTKMKDLREFAASLGIENIGVISKESLCDKILEVANV